MMALIYEFVKENKLNMEESQNNKSQQFEIVKMLN